MSPDPIAAGIVRKLYGEDAPDFGTHPARHSCPGCGLPVLWDDYHQPAAWRHVETMSRWCEGSHTPVMPPAVTDPHRHDAVPVTDLDPDALADAKRDARLTIGRERLGDLVDAVAVDRAVEAAVRRYVTDARQPPRSRSAPPPPPPPGEGFECCASGSCEVCRR